MKGSFATRLKDPSFMTAFNAVIDRLVSELVVTLMKGSFATRAKDSGFMTAFNAWFDRFASEQVVTLMKGSFATRLKDPSFMTAFNALFDSQSSIGQSVGSPVGPSHGHEYFRGGQTGR